MRQIWKGILALAVVAVGTVPAWCAEKEKLVPEAGAVEIMLLRQLSVREDLKLTDAEAKKIDAFTMRQWKKAHSASELSPDKRREQFKTLARENERFLSEVLTPAQLKRLHQVTLQVAGLLCVTKPKVATALGLTPDQVKKARALQQEARKEVHDLLHSGKGEVRGEKLRELRMTSRKRLMGLLTPDQKVKWREMAGEPFKGTITYENFK